MTNKEKAQVYCCLIYYSIRLEDWLDQNKNNLSYKDSTDEAKKRLYNFYMRERKRYDIARELQVKLVGELPHDLVDETLEELQGED